MASGRLLMKSPSLMTLPSRARFGDLHQAAPSDVLLLGAESESFSILTAGTSAAFFSFLSGGRKAGDLRRVRGFSGVGGG
jgi:hypothetical protein